VRIAEVIDLVSVGSFPGSSVWTRATRDVEADRASAEVVRMKRWVSRSAGSDRSARLGHISYKNIPVPEPDSFEKAGRTLLEAHSV
jgi:hypothetical protein